MSRIRAVRCAAVALAFVISGCGGGGSSGSTNPGGSPNPVANPGAAPQGISWSVVSKSNDFFLVDFSDMKFGAGVFVALGNNRVGNNFQVNGSAISYSTDGITWVAKSVFPNFQSYSALVHAQGRFVAVSNRGDIVTSTDGINWALAVSHSGILRADGFFSRNDLKRVAYGSGLFMAAGNGVDGRDVFLTSADGVHWSDTKLMPQGLNGLFGLAHVNGRFIAHSLFAGSGVILASENGGASWAQLQPAIGGAPVNATLRGLAYGNGTYVAIVQDRILAVSHDMVTWTVAANMAEDPMAVQFVNGIFVLTTQGPTKMMTSSDGINWAQATLDVQGGRVFDVDFGNGVYVGTGAPQLLVRGVPTP